MSGLTDSESGIGDMESVFIETLGKIRKMFNSGALIMMNDFR